jgi:hypothetical protein
MDFSTTGTMMLSPTDDYSARASAREADTSEELVNPILVLSIGP